ncbi:MAG: very short patch repair endonuclease [Nanoarchaeota archaeon]
MTDNHTKPQRSHNMSRIKSKNTKTELLFKTILKGTNLRYHPKIIGNPDFGSNKNKVAVFIDGCFWHKCPKCYIKPKSNSYYWNKKIKRNCQRDKEVNSELKNVGWKVIRVWEHQVMKNPKPSIKLIKKYL